MKIYKYKRTQHLPITLDVAWDFLSNPLNLNIITPKQMSFKILQITGGKKMHEGQLILYRVNILPLISTYWLTEITSVKEPYSFVDEQREGPFKLWRHTHTLKEVANGIEMVDEVIYSIPLGVLGQLANSIFVDGQVNTIFNYRFLALENHFAKQILRTN